MPKFFPLPDVTLSEHAGVRYLHLQTPWIQGAMNIKAPFAIELEYVRRMMGWLLFSQLDELENRQAMQLGLGAGSWVKYCYKALGMRTTAVEINPMVINACYQWFKLPVNTDRIQVVQADAAREIQLPHWIGAIDALAVDLYDHEAASPVLDSEDFYTNCRSALTEDGVMVVNLFGRNHHFVSSQQKIERVFGPDRVRAFKPTREGNAIVMAFRQARLFTSHALIQQAQIIENRWHLPATQWLKLLRSLPEPLI